MEQERERGITITVRRNDRVLDADTRATMSDKSDKNITSTLLTRRATLTLRLK